jgi:uncharacterized protein YjbJ (UPF0337 family)
MAAPLWKGGQCTIPPARAVVPAIAKDKSMKWEQIEGNWQHYRGVVKQRWRKLSDARLDATLGRREPLVALIREEYGIGQGESDDQLAAWQDAQD